jgi:membrane dipeptidase
MSLAHNGNSLLADSNTGETQGYLYNNGLSPFGREVIAEMNRVGIMVDLSHPSKGANMEAIRLSKAPVIASHSGVRALADVSRNMDHELLMALKKNSGVIQVVGFASYVKTDSKERIAALAKLQEEFGLVRGAGGRGRGGYGGADGAESASSARCCPVEDPNAPAPQGRGAMLVFDRGYTDYGWWLKLTRQKVNFVTRLKDSAEYGVVEERPVPENSNILRDEVILTILSLLCAAISTCRKSLTLGRG